jgi:multidrug efflux pump
MTKPLEKFLWGFKEIKKAKTYSESKDGVCYIFVELNDDINDKDEFWSKFKIRLQQFKSSLPTGVLALIANDDFGDTSAMLVTLESKTKTYRQLHNYMTDLQDRLRTIPDVANMRLYGEQQEQIGIYIDRDRLSDYGLNTATLLSALQSQGMTLISGSVDDQNTVRPIHLRSKMNTENDVAQQIVYSDPAGNVIRLRDIATIKREYPDADSYVKNNGKKCIVLSLEMNEGHNIVNFGREVKSVIGDFEKTLPDDVTIYPITDQSNVVNSSVVDFLKELLIAIVSVIVVIMLLLPMRVASVAASTIPITIFISLGIFYACGVELNTVTLARAHRDAGHDCGQLDRDHRLLHRENRCGHEPLARGISGGERILFVHLQRHARHQHHVLPAAAHDDRRDERFREVVSRGHLHHPRHIPVGGCVRGAADAVCLHPQGSETG